MHYISQRKRTGRAGFTIIEILVVIAIIAVLAGIFFGVTRGVNERGRISRAQTELSALAQYLEQYKGHYGDYPRVPFPDANSPATATLLEGERGIVAVYDALNGLRGIDGTTFTTGNRQRAFVDRSRFQHEFTPSKNPPTPADPEVASVALIDPWGNAYRYYYWPESPNWTNPMYVLYSMGPSGEHQALTMGTTGYSNKTDPANLDNVYSN